MPMPTNLTTYTCKITIDSVIIGHKIITFHHFYYFDTTLESQESPLFIGILQIKICSASKRYIGFNNTNLKFLAKNLNQISMLISC